MPTKQAVDMDHQQTKVAQNNFFEKTNFIHKRRDALEEESMSKFHLLTIINSSPR